MKTLQEFRRKTKLMGSAFEFILISDEWNGEMLIDECIAEVQRIEKLLTEFSDTSVTSKLNQCAGIHEVQVDAEVQAILKRSCELSALTQGAFDITAGVLKKLYNFKGENFTMPDEQRIRQALKRTGYQKIKILPNNNIFLDTPGMHIGFGAIGKGYAADCVKKMMIKKGVHGGVINASGDLSTWGTRVDGTSWTIGIANPDDKTKPLLWLPVSNASVATSGDYEQYFEHKGIRYSHTINPKTGLPVTGIKSVTVISPSAELSDALATAVFIMGKEIGMHFIGQLPGTHALIIDDKNEVTMSRHLHFNQHEYASV